MREHGTQPTVAATYVADGYGLKIAVRHGHLTVEHGVGRDRQTARFNRASSGLKRLIVIGHTGYVTLEALRWLKDIRAAFVQIDRDSNLITLTAPERLHESKLRRAQVLAADTELGHTATVELLRAKLEHQARIAETRLRPFKAAIVRDKRHRITIADAIREQADRLDPNQSYVELRKIESIAGRYYWQAWARVPIQYEQSWTSSVPDHWRAAGARTAKIDKKWPRRAVTPAHAMLNYLYAVLETEAIIAAHAVGLDPSLGLMHTDQRYRTSLATDLMEPARPTVDELVIDHLLEHELQRGQVLETRRGVCRLGARFAYQLARHAPALRRAVAPFAETLSARLIKNPNHPTPLTRRRHREAQANHRE